MVESKTIRIDSAMMYNIKQYLEKSGTERQLSRLVNRAILTEEEDRYNLRKEVGFLRKTVGYQELDDTWILDTNYHYQSVNFHNEALYYYDNPTERRRESRRSMNKTQYVNECIGSYISMMRAKRQMMENVEVESWYYPQEQRKEKGLSWENVVWDDLKKSQGARVPVLVRIIKGEYQDEDVLSRAELVEKYQEESGQSKPTCIKHMREAFDEIVNSSDWRKSLRSKASNKRYKFITREDEEDEYARQHNRIAEEAKGIVQRIKDHTREMANNEKVRDRRKAVEELEDLGDMLEEIYNTVDRDIQNQYHDGYKTVKQQITSEKNHIEQGGYPAKQI